MNDFSSVFPATDPANPQDALPFPQNALLGNRKAGGSLPVDTNFTIPMADSKGDITFSNLNNFIVTRGTAYCLLPSLASLSKIAGLKDWK